MKKVAIIGLPIVEKEEFGKELSKITRIPYYDSNEAYLIKEEDFQKNISFDEKLREMAKLPTWIMKSFDNRIIVEESDTIIFFDYSHEERWDIVKTSLNREDMAKYYLNGKYFVDVRPKILKMLEEYPKKNIHVFKSREEKENFINSYSTD